MSRYPNPYPYRGWRRNEPVPLYVVPPNDPLGAFFAVLGSVGREQGGATGSELAPFTVAAGTWRAGWRLHSSHPGGWPVLAVLAAVLVAGVVLACLRVGSVNSSFAVLVWRVRLW